METNFTYELIQSQVDGEVIKRIDADGNEAWIPNDVGNKDYQAYLASLDETSVVLEITEPVEESEPTEPLNEPSPDTE